MMLSHTNRDQMIRANPPNSPPNGRNWNCQMWAEVKAEVEAEVEGREAEAVTQLRSGGRE